MLSSRVCSSAILRRRLSSASAPGSTSSPRSLPTSPNAIAFTAPELAGITHRVLNQSSLHYGNTFFDPALRGAALMHLSSNSSSPDSGLAPGGDAMFNKLSSYGAWAGSESTAVLARDANKFQPSLSQFTRNGERVSDISYHPAYHALMSQAVESEVPSYAWNHAEQRGSHVARAALSMLHYQAESGTGCPITMTFACVPALKSSPENGSPAAFKEWIDKASAASYDGHRNVSIHEKRGVTLGMSMTEKNAGSSLRDITTVARPLGDRAANAAGGVGSSSSSSSGSSSTPGAAPGSPFALTGHKWFTSAPMSDGFLTLAYTEGDSSTGAGKGLSCFLVPRWLSDGSRNAGFQVVRQKSKLGDHSNFSSEVEYSNAVGYLIGQQGRGLHSILEMVNHTRLDCALGSAGLMRQAVRNAIWYCRSRSAFGMKLLQAPAMAAVLADLAVESEAGVWMSMKAARAFDNCQQLELQQGSSGSSKVEQSGSSKSGTVTPGTLPFEHSLRRLTTALCKYYLCKRAPALVGEALECIGGNGYDAAWDFERWYRQAPLNSIWEGSGNVQALDILRILEKEPEALQAFSLTVAQTAQEHPALALHLQYVRGTLTQLMTEAGKQGEAGKALMMGSARFITEQLALAWQGHALAEGMQFLKRGGAHPEAAAGILNLWCSVKLPTFTAAAETGAGAGAGAGGKAAALAAGSSAAGIAGAGMPVVFGAAAPGLLEAAARRTAGLDGSVSSLYQAILQREVSKMEEADERKMR